jgi:hypothetical protein
MRRTIILASGLAALCIMGLAIWLYGRRGGQDSVVVPDANTTKGNRESIRPTEQGRTDPRIFALPVEFVMFAKDQFSPCYVDPENKTLYRWKGVVLGIDQLPPRGPYNNYPIFVAYDRSDVSAGLIVKDYALVPVEVPVKYRVTNNYCKPGYWMRSCQMFYAWKGMALSKYELLDRSQDGQPAILDPDKVGQVIEIDMPEYLKNQPQLWKKNS